MTIYKGSTFNNFLRHKGSTFQTTGTLDLKTHIKKKLISNDMPTRPHTTQNLVKKAIAIGEATRYLRTKRYNLCQ